MISLTGRRPKNAKPGTRFDKGFTLIELILVMAMLSAVIAASAQSLSRFFYGRAIEEEAGRFLSMINYTRSQAISTSVPMQLWIEPDQGQYGISPLEGYQWAAGELIELEINEDVQMDLSQQVNNMLDDYRIIFLPDGSLDETSVKTLSFTNLRNDSIYIAQIGLMGEYRVLGEYDAQLYGVNQ